MAEQEHAVAEIIRPELAERGLSDPLEFLYQHMAEFSDAERINLLSYSLDAEGQAFEVQCRLCAEYAKGSRLKSFIEAYQKKARKAGGKVISYAHARKMSRIGVRMIESEKRMTEDYPALSPTYFWAALDAPEFIVALDRAQEMVAVYQEDPEQSPKYTVKLFKEEIHTEKSAEKDSQESFSERISPKVLSPAPEITPGKDQSLPTEANCYDCEHCWQPNGHQRLALVNTLGTAAIDLLLEPCSVWVCRKTKQVLSVRTQIVSRAEAIAKSCGFFCLASPASTEAKDAPAEPIDVEQQGVDETVANEEAAQVVDPVGPSLSPEALDEFLEGES